MFLKPIHRTNKVTKERVVHYRLVESCRYIDSIRHRTILHLGTLESLPESEQKRNLSLRINELVKQSHTGILSLFHSHDMEVERLAQNYFKEIQEKERLDIKQGDYQRVALDSLENKEVQEIGSEWLCKQALDQLGLDKLLLEKSWKKEQIQLAYTQIISRCVYPASELKTAQWLKDNTALCELTGYPVEKISKDKLYSMSHCLYAVKDELEKYLSITTNELFDLEDRIILYDLTNTYFEGSMRTSEIAQFGRSKEKRNDAKLIVLALVVNTEGFLKYSQLFEGNMSDSKSLNYIIEELSVRTTHAARKPTIVIDAGIASEENLNTLSQQGFTYMCVSRSGLNKYEIDTTQSPIEICDKQGKKIHIQRAKVEGLSGNFLMVKSNAKAQKESGMNTRFHACFGQGLTQIKESIHKKNGVKKYDKVLERIGRLKEKYPSASKFYSIDVQEMNKVVTAVSWIKKGISPKEGIYLLRTNLDEKDEKTQWTIYNTIREIEATFRVLKNDLDLRPIYHKTDEAAKAHLHLGILAYWVVNTIRYQLKQKGYTKDWKDLVRTMNTQKMVTTTVQDEYDRQIIVRQSSEPILAVKQIYQTLGYKSKPPIYKKSVVPTTGNFEKSYQGLRASHPI